MRLTDLEELELEALTRQSLSRVDPIFPDQENRLLFLKQKRLHNTCSNPQCAGYEGHEDEDICPVCKHELLKLL